MENQLEFLSISEGVKTFFMTHDGENLDSKLETYKLGFNKKLSD